MSEETHPEKVPVLSGDLREQLAEPSVLKLAEHILDSSDAIGVSDQLDVASIFYTAVATIVGSLCAACLYPLLRPFTPRHPVEWFAFFLCVIPLGGLLGFAVVAITFNARGYTRWQRKYRPDERS